MRQCEGARFSSLVQFRAGLGPITPRSMKPEVLFYPRSIFVGVTAIRHYTHLGVGNTQACNYNKIGEALLLRNAPTVSPTLTPRPDGCPRIMFGVKVTFIMIRLTRSVIVKLACVLLLPDTFTCIRMSSPSEPERLCNPPPFLLVRGAPR